MLEELRGALGTEMAHNEARGLDFTPPHGETPRHVQERLRAWFAEVVRRGRPVVAVTHKGVIRATLALALGWDMTDPCPVRIDWACAHMFSLDTAGAPKTRRLNIPLARDLSSFRGARLRSVV